jgi:hypothetical protein
MTGVFVSRGMRIAIPPGGVQLFLDDNGKPTGGNIKIQVHFDVVPSWIEIALKHLEDAHRDKLARNVAWSVGIEANKAQTLEHEFQSSMQAIIASAIALDAFYAVVQPKAKIDPNLILKWRNNRTARFAQVAEVIRVAFQLKPKGTIILRSDLKEIYELRDLAVHPSGAPRDPVLHPELNVGVEWRFCAFRFEHALAVTRRTVQVIHELVLKGKPANAEVEKYAESLRASLETFITHALFDSPPNP